MKRLGTIAILLVGSHLGAAEQAVVYTLSYKMPGDNSVHVRIDLAEAQAAPLSLVMPRSYPGGYGLVHYDSFVESPKAFAPNEEPVSVMRDSDGPRWTIGAAGQKVSAVEYSIDIARMEKSILSAVEASKIRPLYAGLLGYSVFGYIDGLQTRQTSLRVNAPQGWPVFCTLTPSIPAVLETLTASAKNYDVLADSQILMGPALRLRRLPGKISLVLAAYVESDAELAEEVKQARAALDRVQEYFGDIPFDTYTVHIELLRPLPGHDYDFSQEHVNSGTFSFSTERALTPQSTEIQRTRSLFNFAHHMTHSWIPKRAYSDGYSPFSWEIPPVSDTIWFNEGFAQYAAAEALAIGMAPQEAVNFRRRYRERMIGILNDAPESIRRMPLSLLSREASFLYSVDFRTGMNTFARGSSMAAEMDARIQQQSQGRSSLRSALRALLLHTQHNQNPFQVTELTPLFREATGVDVHDILERWLKPLTH